MKKTLLLGIGNYILSDDGLSVHALEKLEKYSLPENVEIVDGGTCGLDLLRFFEGINYLVIIDAINAGKSPGTMLRYENGEIPAYLALKMSPHDIGLPDLLASAKLRDIYPEKVVVLGIQPKSLDIGVDLSPEVEKNLDMLIQTVINEVSVLAES